jgi:hypothetical protein
MRGGLFGIQELRSMRHALPWLLATVVLSVSPALAQEGQYKIETGQDALPAALAVPIKEILDAKTIRVVNGEGKPVAKIWLRKAIPASSKPAGSKGAVLYPFLGEGELLGVLEFVAEGHDYRDQTIAPGVYALRYGLQPVNGDHLGVSTYRDYALLVPAAKEKTATELAKKDLERQSAEASGSNHPAVLLLTEAPGGATAKPGMVRDEGKNLWGVVLPLALEVKGEGAAVPVAVQLILIGAAMT